MRHLPTDLFELAALIVAVMRVLSSNNIRVWIQRLDFLTREKLAEIPEGYLDKIQIPKGYFNTAKIPFIPYPQS